MNGLQLVVEACPAPTPLRSRYGAYEEGGDGCYVLTMHPQIIGRRHRMAMLERVVGYILDHDDVWFAQMIDIANLFRSREAATSS